MLVILLLFTILLTFCSLCRFLHFSAEQQTDKNKELAAILQTTPGGGGDSAAT